MKKAAGAAFFACAREDSNLHPAIAGPGPQPGASTSSATGARKGESSRRFRRRSAVGYDLLPDFLPPFFPPFFEAALPEPAFAFEILAARSLDMPFLRRPSYCLSFLTDEPWSFAMQIPYPDRHSYLSLMSSARQSRARGEIRARGKSGHRRARVVEATRPGETRGKVP